MKDEKAPYDDLKMVTKHMTEADELMAILVTIVKKTKNRKG